LAWRAEHENTFHDLQAQITEVAKLAHREDDWDVCVFTDASDAYRGRGCNTMSVLQLTKDPIEQTHEPLAFLSAGFNATEHGWNKFEKEAFVIVQVFKKMDYLLLAEIYSCVHRSPKPFLYTIHMLLILNWIGIL